MVNKCDICGFNYGPNDRYCGGCNVDLREPGGSENMNIEVEPDIPKKAKAKGSSKKKDSDYEDVIHWHSIRAMGNLNGISFSNFLFLMLVLGHGMKKMGFCDCASCNQGYREMLATIANVAEKKNLTANSREIVIKARGKQIDGHTIDLSKLMRKEVDSSQDTTDRQDTRDPAPQQTNHGKIVIELDAEILENAVITVLKSERGQEIIRGIPRKRGRPKNMGEIGKK